MGDFLLYHTLLQTLISVSCTPAACLDKEKCLEHPGFWAVKGVKCCRCPQRCPAAKYFDRLRARRGDKTSLNGFGSVPLSSAVLISCKCFGAYCEKLVRFVSNFFFLGTGVSV